MCVNTFSIKLPGSTTLSNQLLINNVRCDVAHSTDHTYLVHTHTQIHIKDILCIQVPIEPPLIEFLPYSMKVNGHNFIRKFSSFYLPTDSTEATIARFFNLVAPEYEDLIVPSLNKAVIHLLLEEIRERVERISKDFKILDYGIGTGLIQEVVDRHFKTDFGKVKVPVFGVDISQKMVDICRSKGLSVKRIVENRTGFPDGYFDGVLLSFVTQYFMDLSPFSEIFRILKPSGIIAFNLHVPEWNNIDRYKAHLEKIGFKRILLKRRTKSVCAKDYKIIYLVAKKPRKRGHLIMY